jgi:hypothetical protein
MSPVFIKPKSRDDTGINNLHMKHLSSVKLILAANNGNKIARAEIQRRHYDRMAKGMKPIPAVLKFLGLEFAKPLSPEKNQLTNIILEEDLHILANQQFLRLELAKSLASPKTPKPLTSPKSAKPLAPKLKALAYFISNEGDHFEICDIKEISINISRNTIEIYDGEIYQFGTTNKISMIFKNETSSLKVVKYKNMFFRFDSFLWYFLYGSYVNNFIYLDGNISNITFKNLLPRPFKCASLKFSKSQMEEMFEYNPDDGCLYWFHINNKNHLWNDLLPFEVANRIYDGNNYVDINGDIYLAYDVVNKLCEFNLPNQFQPLDGDKKNLKASNLIGEA